MFTPGLYMVVVFTVLLSAVTWLFIGALSNDISILLRVVMVIVGILAIVVMSNRNIYLPFLGEMALPSLVLQDTKPIGDIVLAIDNLPPNCKVIFWAAKEERSQSITGPANAYRESLNGGVCTSNSDGVAQVTITCPQQYKVNRFGFDKVLPRHIHFRYELPNKHGLFSSVQTLNVTDVCG